MTAMQRRKGATGERELFAALSDLLGHTVRRNISQARAGGADGLDVPGWAIECKRCERLELAAWWAQTSRQAEATGRRPVLFYRKPWSAVVDAAELAPAVFEPGRETVTLRLEAAAQLMRAGLGWLPCERVARPVAAESSNKEHTMHTTPQTLPEPKP